MLKEKLIKWTRDYLGEETKVVLGISGGVDSSVAAAICVEAVGKDRVIGVLMPNGNQHDIDKSYELVKFLDLNYYELNIENIQNSFNTVLLEKFDKERVLDNKVYYSNNPARVRMTLLYAVAAIIGNCRVCNTCNKSEDYVGFNTKGGDNLGDFSPLSDLLKTEVKQLGYELNLPKDLVEKIPEDGMLKKADGTYKTDEDAFGFTYAELDHYIKTGEIGDLDKKIKIDTMHKNNLHKLLPMPKFDNGCVGPMTAEVDSEFFNFICDTDKFDSQEIPTIGKR